MVIVMSTMSPSAAPLSRVRRLSADGSGVLRPAGRRARSVAMVVLSLFASMVALGVALTRYAEESPTGELSNIENTTILLALGGAVLAAVALVRRHDAPFAVTLVTALVPLVLPLDATAALFALPALVRARSGRRVWLAAGLVALTTVVALYRDASGATTGSSMLKMLAAPQDTAGDSVPLELSVWVPAIVAAVLIAASVGSGLIMRSRQDLVVTQGHAAAAQQSTAVLTDQLGRQAERDLIAREVHDVIGHRLSLLSLHAGGLEVAAGADPRLAQSAALVRDSAQHAMEDLRSLLRVLREPGATATSRTATPSLADLPEVVEETVMGGMPVVSTIYLTQAEEADQLLARAVYRIVQELLTNARRHAPGAPVRLLVQGGPAEGIRIETANRLTGEPPRPRGNGLTGISERVTLLGGTMRSGLDVEQAFRVAVWLPWTPPEGEHQ